MPDKHGENRYGRLWLLTLALWAKCQALFCHVLNCLLRTIPRLRFIKDLAYSVGVKYVKSCMVNWITRISNYKSLIFWDFTSYAYILENLNLWIWCSVLSIAEIKKMKQLQNLRTVQLQRSMLEKRTSLTRGSSTKRKASNDYEIWDFWERAVWQLEILVFQDIKYSMAV